MKALTAAMNDAMERAAQAEQSIAASEARVEEMEQKNRSASANTEAQTKLEALRRKHKALQETLKEERDSFATAKTRMEAEKSFLVSEVKMMMGKVAEAQRDGGRQDSLPQTAHGE